MAYIMFFWITMTSQPVVTEFGNLEACNTAKIVLTSEMDRRNKESIEQHPGTLSFPYSIVCTPKYILK